MRSVRHIALQTKVQIFLGSSRGLRHQEGTNCQARGASARQGSARERRANAKQKSARKRRAGPRQRSARERRSARRRRQVALARTLRTAFLFWHSLLGLAPNFVLTACKWIVHAGSRQHGLGRAGALVCTPVVLVPALVANQRVQPDLCVGAALPLL